MIDHLTRSDLFRRDCVEAPGILPLMRIPTPDTAERKRLDVQAIAFALPPIKAKPDG